MLDKISPRRWVQMLTLAASNLYVVSWLRFVPCGFLNCSRCPWATVKCPLIAFQTGAMVMGLYGSMPPKTISLIMLTGAVLLVFGTTLATWTCGWLCPFGFIQDMFHKIPTPKFRLPGWVGWGRLPLFVLLGIAASHWTQSLFFCSICPPGTINRLIQDAAGIPQFLRGPEGTLAPVSAGVLIATLLLAVFSYRPFCNLLCPIGGLYGLFNRISGLFRNAEPKKCNACGLCKNACDQGLAPLKDRDHASCERCFECHKACPRGALKADVRL